MSRSNDTSVKNPATRWFEWSGEKGEIRYYDKTRKENVVVGDKFQFLLLDQLAAVGGWHEPSGSAIRSNEVRDTREHVMVVRSFNGGPIAEGLYKAIKDKVKAAGGHFVANCYIAWEADDGALEIGSLRLKGAALMAWSDFSRKHRNEIYKKAIVIDGSVEGQKGRVKFKTPTFKTVEVSQDTATIATDLDKELQEFLTAYMKRTKQEQAETVAAPETDDSAPDFANYDDETVPF